MKISDILKKVGTGIIKNIVPGAGAVIDIVNEFLPDDKKLPNDATGDQVQGVIESLPPADRASIMSKELDVQIEEIRGWSSVVDSLSKADASGSSTRPAIANRMAWLIVAEVAVLLICILVVVVRKDAATLKALQDSWELILVAMATPTALLRAYFGLRTQEKKARYANSVGQEAEKPGGLGGIFKNIFG